MQITVIPKVYFCSEVGGYFQVQFYLTLKWFESRLRFKNLKGDISLNSFLPDETEEIWVPELIFSNTEEKPSTKVDTQTSLTVEKKGNFILSKDFENENIQYFSGKENPLQLKRFYNQRFLCNYNLRWYPFDVQRCFLLLEAKKSYSPFINLGVEKYEYNGEKFLTQYEVVNIAMLSRNNSQGVQEIVVEILLGRELLGVVLNIICPTMALNIISYSTNFYREEYFETVVTINLTTMLVIVTLFVSVRPQ